jgi:hypothetical protein
LAGLLILLLNSVNAYTLEKQGISISIDREGIASIKEKYFLSFENNVALDSFKKTVKDNGPNFVAWKIFDERIFPHVIGPEDELLQKSVSFDEETGSLEINYILTTKIVRLGEQARTTVFSLIQNRFNYFVQGASVIIPKNTAISIKIPDNATLLSALPVPSSKDHEIVWNGFLSSNQFELTYEIKKPIAPEISLSDLVESIFSREESFFILVVVAAVIILLYWKKDAISDRIEGYIIKHSEIKPEPVEEEIRVKG